MKKMNSHYNKLKAMTLTINGIISDLAEKRDSIKDKAYDEDRGMTKREQERYYEIDEQIFNIEDCVAYIENAMDCLEEYID